MKIAFNHTDAKPFDTEAAALAAIPARGFSTTTDCDPSGWTQKVFRYLHLPAHQRANGRHWYAIAVSRPSYGGGEELAGYVSEDAPLGRYL